MVLSLIFEVREKSSVVLANQVECDRFEILIFNDPRSSLINAHSGNRSRRGLCRASQRPRSLYEDARGKATNGVSGKLLTLYGGYDIRAIVLSVHWVKRLNFNDRCSFFGYL